MGAVIASMDRAFAGSGLSVERLPGTAPWVWEDTEMREMGLPRYYVLSESVEYSGYPLLTIRQAYSTKFDSWVTMSVLILGPDEEDIMRSVSLAITNHMGAYAGVKFTTATIAANRNTPIAGMVGVKHLMEMKPSIISSADVETAMAEVDDLIRRDDGMVN